MLRFVFCLLLTIISPVSKALDVLFVHSYHHEYAWVDTYYSAFKNTLKTTSLRDFEMDTKRLNHDSFQSQANKALAQIQQYQPKVVVLADDNAMKYLGQRLLDSGFYVVFMGVNANPRHYVQINDRLAGILERPLIKSAVNEAIRILPGTKKIRVLMDAGITSAAIVESSFNGKMKQTIGWADVDVAWANNYEHWQALVKESPDLGYDLLLIGNFAKLANKQGETISVPETARWTGKNSKIPVFSFWKYSVGAGMSIGGVVMSGADQGNGAAEITNAFLQNNRFVEPLIRRPQQGYYMFSRSELERWQINLPEDIATQAIWQD